MKNVYLAGPINACSDSEVHDWRNTATALLAGLNVKNPSDRDYRGREMEPGVAEEIVVGDLADINQCDYMIAMCFKPSVGTSMEIFHYFTTNRGRVVVVVPSGSPSPWLVYHSHALRNSIEEACELVRMWEGVTNG